MMHLGLYLEKDKEKLVDLDTGEIMTENEAERIWFLGMLQYTLVCDYTLQFI